MKPRAAAAAFGALLLLSACTAGPVGTTAGTAFTEVYVADFRSEQPAACRPTDVPQNHGQARDYFARARQVDYKTLHDHYDLAPCFVEGTLKQSGKSCDFQIRAGATAAVQCGGQKLYFACDTCGDLFGGAK